MTISIRATRSLSTSDVSLDGATLVNQGTTTPYTITDYNAFSVYTVATNVGTVTRTTSAISLVVPTTTATQVNLTVTKDGKVSVFTIAIGATAIVKPAITSPTASQLNVNLAPTLVSTTFATAPIGADTQSGSKWQIASDSAFTTIVWDSGTTTSTNSIQVPAGLLATGTVYYLRVAHIGVTLGTSQWSNTTTFTTTTQYISTPTIAATGGPSAVAGAPTLTTSAFNTVGGSDTHASTDWQVLSAGGAVIWQSIGDVVNLTSIQVPSGFLVISTVYTIRARQSGAILGQSGWGTLSITTASKFSYEKYLAANLGSKVVVFGQDVDNFVKLPDLPPLTMISRPSGTAIGFASAGVAFSPDGRHLAALSLESMAVTVYKRTGDSFSVLPNTPLSQPSLGAASTLSYSTDGTLLSVGSGTNVVLYQVSGDNYNRLSDPTGQPSTQTVCAAVSPDGAYFVVGKVDSIFNNNTKYPTLYVYKRSGTTLTLLTSFRIGSIIRHARFSPDGKFLIVAAGADGITLLKRTGDSFTITSNIPPIVGYNNADFSWSSDSSKALNGNSFYGVSDTGTLTKLTSIPGSSGASALSGDDQYVSATDGSGPPYVRTSKLVNGVFVEIPFPTSVGIDYIPSSLRFWPGYQG